MWKRWTRGTSRALAQVCGRAWSDVPHVACTRSISVNMYYTPAWHDLLPRIFSSWPVLPSYRGSLPQDIDPCVIRDLAEFVATVVQLGVIRMSSVDAQALRQGARAFVSTVASTR